jgi:DNA-binding NtrC family response regulator
MERPRFIGVSPSHLQLLVRLTRIAPTDAEVLITGPSGSGKELYARHLHCESARASQPFVAVNCGAIPPELFENEMFGHAAGAYTGAKSAGNGLVVEADGGTLFLDEVDSLLLPTQVKLLRFLQRKEYRRLGDARVHHADVRIVSATNADLTAAVRDGFFREDLFYRLRVVPVEVPPLRERPEDIPLLIEEYADRFSDAYRLPRIQLLPRTLEALTAYSWPGNIRELENCVKYLTCLQLARAVDVYDLLIDNVRVRPPARRASDNQVAAQRFTEARDALLRDFERRYVIDVLGKTRGNVTQAAAEAGEYRKKISRLMKKHGIDATSVAVQASETGDVPTAPGAVQRR